MLQMYGELKRILVPVPMKGDFKAPLRQAFYFHSKYGSQITLLNVVPDASFLQRILTRRRLKQRPEKVLKKFKRKVRNYFKDDPIPTDLHFRVINGDIVSSVLKFAKERRMDLIILKKTMAAQGRKRFFRQENTDRLIANSPCPVLTLYQEPETEGINKILFPVDITKRTENKVAWAKSLGKHFGAEIHVVSVISREKDQLQSFSYQKGRRIVDDIRGEGIKAELVIMKRVDNRTMEAVVLDYAREYHPDLLLIMTHQENVLFENYLGSFAREMIHRANMPVFSVVPHKISNLQRHY